MRSESVRWKEGRRCQFSGLCPHVQCRTRLRAQCRTRLCEQCRKSQFFIARAQVLSCHLPTSKYQYGGIQDVRKFSGLCTSQMFYLTCPGQNHSSSLFTCKLHNINRHLWSIRAPNVLRHWPSTAAPYPATPPLPPIQLLSPVTLGAAPSSNVASAERLQWCAAADICGTRRSRPLPFLPDAICLGGRCARG